MHPYQPIHRATDEDTVIQMAIEDPADPRDPRVRRPVDELSRIERLIRISDLAMTPYERKLERGLTLSVDEERMMNTHINTLMKLEMNKAALEAKMQFQKKTNAELAQFMLVKGMEKEHIISLLGDSSEILNALEE